MTAVATTTKEPTDLTVNTADPRVRTKFLEAFTSAGLDKLPREKQGAFLMALGQHIGVRAELGELILYQGKPYITIDGRIRLAHGSGLLNGIDVQPASSSERLRYGCAEGDHLWKCLVWRKGSTRHFVGWGFVPKAGDRNPVTKSHPREMARKRAKYDALRLAFPPDETITPFHERMLDNAEQMAEEAAALLPPALAAGLSPELMDETIEGIEARDEIAAQDEVFTDGEGEE